VQNDDFALAADLVVDAGRLAAQMLAGGLTSKRKTSVSDIVTAADHAAEELVVGRLRAERPEDGIIGEEGTNDASTDAAARTWFVDPVDGTYNFATGLSAWCAALAVRDDTGLLLGAVYEPVTELLWVGGRDRTTTLNGTDVVPLPDRPLTHCSVATYLHPSTLSDDGVREPLLRVWSAAATVRMLGSGSVELAAISGSRLGAYVQTDCLDWDWLPGAALVEGAGGATAVFELNGHRWHVAGNAQTVEEIIALLRT
jgi:myo-inositol-1(or 4)-monophosphatase